MTKRIAESIVKLASPAYLTFFRQAGPVCIIDPSELYRPEVKAKKAKGLFREYSIDKTDHIQTRVRDTYLKMHTYQTVDYVKQKVRAIGKMLSKDHQKRHNFYAESFDAHRV